MYTVSTTHTPLKGKGTFLHGWYLYFIFHHKWSKRKTALRIDPYKSELKLLQCALLININIESVYAKKLFTKMDAVRLFIDR